MDVAALNVKFGATGVDAVTGAANRVSGSIEATAKKIRGIGKGMFLGLTLPISGAATFAFSQASNLEESMSKAGVIFGSYVDGVVADSERAATAAGLSQAAYLESASNFGQFFQLAGKNQQEASDLSGDLVQLAADMASFSNTSVDEALASLQSGLSGEAEPLRKYGVFLSDAAVQAKALELGLYDVNGVLSEENKILARNAIIFDQTTNAQGDYARTADGAANSLRTFKASAQNLGSVIGQRLLPTATKLIQFATKLATAMQKLSPTIITVGLVVAGLVAAIGPLLIGIGAMISAIAAIAPAFALLLGPVGLVAAAIIGLGIVFRGPIIDALKSAGEKLKDFFDIFKDSFDALRGSGASDVMNQINEWGGIASGAGEGVGILNAAIRAFGDALGVFTGRDDSAFFYALAGGVDAAVAAIQGFLSAIFSGDLSGAIASLSDLGEIVVGGSIVLGGMLADVAWDLWGWINGKILGSSAVGDGTGGPAGASVGISLGDVAVIGGLKLGGMLADAAGGLWNWVKARLLGGGTDNVVTGGPVVRETTGWSIDIPSIAVKVDAFAGDFAVAAADFAIKLGGAIKDAIPQVPGFAADLGVKIVDEVRQAVAALGISGADVASFATKVRDALVSAVGATIGFAADLGDSILREAQEAIGSLNITAADVFGFGEKIGAALRSAIATTVKFAADLAVSLGTEVVEALPLLGAYIAGLDWGTVATGIKDGIILAVKGLATFGAAVALALAGFLKGLVFGEGDVDWSGMAGSIGSGIQTALAAIPNPFTAFKTKIVGWREDLKASFGGGGTGFETSGEGGYGSGGGGIGSILTDFIQPLLDWKMPSIPNPFEGWDFMGWAQPVIDGIKAAADGINAGLDALDDAMARLSASDGMDYTTTDTRNEPTDTGGPAQGIRTPRNNGADFGQLARGTAPVTAIAVPDMGPLIAAFTGAATAITAATLAIESRVTAMAATVTTMAANAGSGFLNTFTPPLNAAVAQAGAVQASLTAIFSGIAAVATNLGIAAGQGFNSGIVTGTSSAVAAAGGAAAALTGIFSGVAAAMTNLGIAGGQGFAFGVSGGMAQAVGAAYAGANAIRGALSGIGNMSGVGFGIGASLGQGIAGGIQSQIGAVASAAAALVGAAVSAARNAGAIRSPSKVMADQIGLPLAQGVAVGMGMGARDVIDAARSLIGGAAGVTVPGGTVGSASGGIGAAGSVSIVTHFHEPIYGVDGLEDAVTGIFISKVAPALQSARATRDRAQGVRR